MRSFLTLVFVSVLIGIICTVGVVNEKVAANTTKTVSFDSLSANDVSVKRITVSDSIILDSDDGAKITLMSNGGNPYIFLERQSKNGQMVTSAVYFNDTGFVVGGHLNPSTDSGYRFALSFNPIGNEARLQLIDKNDKIRSFELNPERIEALLTEPKE